MKKLNLALKEWAAVIEAMESGTQALLFRKGGIKEVDDEFVVEQNQFFLYPTFEHQDASLLKPEFQYLVSSSEASRPGRLVRITSFADVTNVELLDNAETASRYFNQHIWNQRYVDMRLAYKPDKPLYVLTLQIHKLEAPFEFKERSEYVGCRSWVTIADKDLSDIKA